MDEIDLKDLFNYFWTKKIIIALVILVGLAFGAVYTAFIQKPVYTSYTTVLLTKEGDSSAITTTDITLNKNLIETYSAIIKSKKVAKQVISNLELDVSVEQLISMISVSSISDTEIIKISVTNSDNNLSRDIANETAEVFENEVKNYYNIENIGIIDRAESTENPSNVNVIKQLLLSILVGVVLGFAVVFVMYYFDTTIKSVEEVENKLGIPVIGTIPHTGGEY